MTGDGKPRALLLTVGTGDVDKVRETLMEPLKMSVRAGDWTRVVLLPSRLTVDAARALQAELTDVPIELAPLPRPGDEEDADACFAHFDRVIGELREAGVAPADILVDFTRGTKAMSAALVLAAVRHGLPRLRYISSAGSRDARGIVVPGTERLGEVHTTIASARRMLDRAREFFRAGNFAAVLEVLPDPGSPFAGFWPGSLLDLVRFIRPLARFYAGWDRLDYRAAAGVALIKPPADAWEWRAGVPTVEMRAWVERLAEPFPVQNGDKAARLRLLVCDVLVNGERRIRDHQYEDATLRAYRVLEMVGQARLFDHDLDSSALPPEHPAVQEFQRKLSKGGSKSLDVGKDGRLMAGREQVARLLKNLGDPLAEKLVALANDGMMKASARNHSILIHGYEAVGADDEALLQALYGKLEALILEDLGQEGRTRLAVARFHSRMSL